MESKSSDNVSTKTKKSLVRNAERGTSKTIASDKSSRNTDKHSGCSKVIDSVKTTQSEKYKQPQVNSSLGILKKIRETQDGIPHKTLRGYNEIEVGERDAAKFNITKKLNFHFDDKLYKDLVALNTRDSKVLSKTKSRISSSRSVPITVKDIEPQLDDFYDNNHQADVAIKSSAPKMILSPVLEYNGKDFYEKVHLWNNHYAS